MCLYKLQTRTDCPSSDVILYCGRRKRHPYTTKLVYVSVSKKCTWNLRKRKFLPDCLKNLWVEGIRTSKRQSSEARKCSAAQDPHSEVVSRAFWRLVSKSCDECKGSFARGCEAKRWSHWTCSSLGTIFQPMRINSVPDVKCFCNDKNVLCAQSMVRHFVRHPLCLSCSNDCGWMTLIKCFILCNGNSIFWEQQRLISARQSIHF